MRRARSPRTVHSPTQCCTPAFSPACARESADVAIYIFAFIPIATTVVLGVYSRVTDPYFSLVLDYVVVCTVNLNGTLNAIAFNYFLSEHGKKSVGPARVEPVETVDLIPDTGPGLARPR